MAEPALGGCGALADVPATSRTRYVDAYDSFFVDATRVHVRGQAGSPTTATATVAAGATEIPLDSAAGVVPGMVYVLKDTDVPQLVLVESVAGSTVRVSPAVDQVVVAGETLWPLWADRHHLTSGGYRAFWGRVAAALDPDGERVFRDPGAGRIVLLGNSWGVSGGAGFRAAFGAAFPTASIELAAVAGDTSQQLLDRFEADVPGTPAYVVFNEPGINDTLQDVPLTVQGAQVAALAARITARGAVPVYVGPPPLRGWESATAATAAGLRALARREPVGYAAGAATIAETSASPRYTVRLGKATDGGDRTGTAVRNVAVGHAAQKELTSGADNVAVGYGAQHSVAGGRHNAAVGSNAQNDLTGSFNTAVGHSAQADQTTGVLNTGLGYRAQFAPAATVAHATTTGARQTALGAETGQAHATPVDDSTAVGYRAVFGADRATALGARAEAGHAGSVALGADARTTEVQQVALGPRHLALGEVASVPPAPGAGEAFLFVDVVDGRHGLFVRFPTGTVQRLATEE